MTVLCPRVINGNRGDLASRLGILSALEQLGVDDVAVFCRREADIASLRLRTFRHGPLVNLIPRPRDLKVLRTARSVVWTGGLDLQDDSSLLKLVHTLLVFSLYRLLRLKTYVLMQGAGPLNSRLGRLLTRQILNRAEAFVVRDSDSLRLLQSLNSRCQLIPGCDGIFAGDLRPEDVSHEELRTLDRVCRRTTSGPLIGFNLRLWFHFTSDWVPYQFAKERYRQRASKKMRQLQAAAASYLRRLREELDAEILLISMYEPGVQPWEDDVCYLGGLKEVFPDDPAIRIADIPLRIPAFAQLLSRLDLMVGMRLHSALIALRQGVPAINLSYTLKGRGILRDLGLGDCVVDVEQFMARPELAVELTCRLLGDPGTRRRVQEAVDRALRRNEQVLRQLTERLPRNA